MAKVWVLDTETKGTGAEVVPLEKVLRKPEPAETKVRVPPKPRERPPAPPAPTGPRRFKVVDVVSLETLAEGATTRATVDLLEGLRSSVDVRVYVWEPRSGEWRLLTLDEQRTLWELRRGSPGAR